MYPVSPSSAKRYFKRFLDDGLRHFGTYEDAILKDESILFHSVQSVSLNAGLLDVTWCISQVRARCKKSIPMNSIEGFVRQLIWREYMRGIYVSHYHELIDKTLDPFKRVNRLRWNRWKGDEKGTGISILDSEIGKAQTSGYGHHIVRLMVFLNIFTLLDVELRDVVRWFTEVCAIDAAPWVMYSNIAAMGYFSPRFMHKPYISSATYLLKMSDYARGEWCEIWTALFYTFLVKHRKHFVGSSKVYLRNLSHYDAMKTGDKKKISSIATRVRSELVTKKR
jgi:deoxyribodipyrimidine photolyase-related protein